MKIWWMRKLSNPQNLKRDIFITSAKSVVEVPEISVTGVNFLVLFKYYF